MLTGKVLAARKKRLLQLSLGLGKDRVLIGEDMGPMLHAEKREYLRGLGAAIDALLRAKLVLAEALLRIEKEGRPA